MTVDEFVSGGECCDLIRLLPRSIACPLTRASIRVTEASVLPEAGIFQGSTCRKKASGQGLQEDAARRQDLTARGQNLKGRARLFDPDNGSCCSAAWPGALRQRT